MKIAIIDKAPSRNNYTKYFGFPFELFHMSSIPVHKLLKKDIDLEIDLEEYDLVILVGAEAAKNYAKITSVTTHAGLLVDNKFVALQNPAALIFKPEGKPDFERATARINELVETSLNSQGDRDGDFAGITDPEEATKYLLEVYNCGAEYIAMDTEGTGLYPRNGYVIGLSISHKVGQGRYILTDILSEEHIALLQKIIENYPVVFHNMKYDIKMIEYHLSLDFSRSVVHDTMVLHYILDENAPHGLKPLAIKYTKYGDYDKELEVFKKDYCKSHGILEEDFTYDLIPFEIMWPYASKDTAVTLELFPKFYNIVKKNDKLLFVYDNLLNPGTLFFNEMEEVGIPIDIERMSAAGEYLDEKIQEAKEKVYSFDIVKKFEADQDKVFNPASVIQLRSLLFDYVGLTPTGKRTGTGAISTDAEVLEELSEEHQLPAAILNVRKLTKIRNTYVTKILPEIDRDGRVRTNFNLIFTTSGRASSSGKFNAQQIIRDDPIIKGCIKAPKGYKIVSQDLKTGEMYYAAVLSKDKNLQEIFKLGGDFHSNIAKMVFSLTCAAEAVKELYPGLRQSAKAISFGILYGSGPQKVADTVSKETKDSSYTIEQAAEDINSYFRKFSKLKKWLNERKAFILANGYTYSFFGRKRRLPNAFSPDKGIAAHEVRSGINSEVQSLCSDINLLAAMDTHKELKAKKLDAKIFMLVHDSIVALVREDLVPEYCEIIKRNTQKDRGCSIPGTPIGVDQEIGDDYSFGKFDKVYKFEGNKLSRI